MNEIYLIIKQEWIDDVSLTPVDEIVGIYETEEEARADVDRIVRETLGDFTEEQAREYKIITDIEELNGEDDFYLHEDDGVFRVAEIMSEHHGFDFPLFRFNIPFRGSFDLLRFEVKWR